MNIERGMCTMYNYILPFKVEGSDKITKRTVTSLCRLTRNQLHTWAVLAFPGEVLMITGEGDDYV